MTIAPIVQTTQVKPAPARAFALFTGRMGEWWPKGKTLGQQHQDIVIEPWPGGRWFERDVAGAETDWGRVRQWDPPSRVVLSWEIACGRGHDPDVQTEVEIAFAPSDDGGTVVRLEHRNLERFGRDAAAHAEQVRSGWPGMLGEYAVYAARAAGAPELAVRWIPGSPFGRAVLAALEEKSAAYDFVPVQPNMLRDPAHTAMHPFAKVPVLDHGSFRLYETQAILRYLDRILPEPPLTPANPKAAARMDQVMNISDWYLSQGVGNVIGFQRVVGPRLLGIVPDEDVIAGCMEEARVVVAELARLLGDQPYFAGETLSLADLLAASQLAFLAQTPEWAKLAAGKLKLVAWLDRMLARPSFEATTWDRLRMFAEAA